MVNNGYELIPQDNENAVDLPSDDDEGNTSDEDEELTVDALVRASADALAEANALEPLNDNVKTLVEESEEQQAKELAREQSDIWRGEKRDNIPMDDEKIEQIKSVMSNIKLSPNTTIPPWASEGGEDMWKQNLETKITK